MKRAKPSGLALFFDARCHSVENYYYLYIVNHTRLWISQNLNVCFA